MFTKKLLRRVLCAAALTCLLIPAANAAGDTLVTQKTSGEKIAILHTNDVHCQVDQVVEEDGTVSAIGYAGVAAYKKELEALYGEDNVVLVDAGDAIQGGPIGTLSNGAYIVDIMNAVGYDLAIPGNHEFDYGMSRFLWLVREHANFPYLCTNFIDLTRNSQIFSGYELYRKGDTLIAFVGVATPESITSSTPTHFQNEAGEYIYGFCQDANGQQLYDAVQRSVDEARSKGADYVIAVAHLGTDAYSSPWTSDELVANTRGIDALIDGHSHSTYTKAVPNLDGKLVTMSQTGTKLANLGVLTIDTGTGQINAQLVSNYAQQDPEALEYISSVTQEFDQLLHQVVATSQVNLTTLDPDTGLRAVRSAETNLGDFCADAYRTVLGTDIAFINGGGVRADIDAGDVTYEDIISVHPFGNELCVMEVTGQEILEALETGSITVPQEGGSFLHVSGLSYTINTAIPSPVVLDEYDQFVRLDGPNRVTNISVDGEPLVLDKTYTLASINYLLKDGGGGLSMLQDNPLLQDSVMLDNAALIKYVTEHLDGVIGQEYANPRGQGRITIVNQPASADVDQPQSEPAPVVSNDYTVLPGDTLWSIAATKLGQGNLWEQIYQLNQASIPNPDLIYIGQELKLPA